jgi:UDP-glucose 4-epimerase
MRVAITGGAGFIGSHLTDGLLEKGYDVTVIDNLSSGKKEYVNPRSEFIPKDLINENITRNLADMDAVFHMAADPDVRSSSRTPTKGFNNNVVATFRTLEACRKAKVKHLVFASTSTVYGDADVIPTPEDYPCHPISNYGASKLACEAYCSSYANLYDIKTTVVRYANIYGERSSHGVMYDFYQKLKKNPKELEILGDGNQDKSYLHVEDCVSATITAFENQEKIFDAFNIGSSDKYKVNDIAKEVCSNMKLKPEFKYTGGTRGWIGDVKLTLLDAQKIEDFGWSQKISLKEGIKRYVKWLSKT